MCLERHFECLLHATSFTYVEPITLSPRICSLSCCGRSVEEFRCHFALQQAEKSVEGGQVTKSIWAYIKKNKLNAGRIISPDATLKKVFPVAKSALMQQALKSRAPCEG